MSSTRSTGIRRRPLGRPWGDPGGIPGGDRHAPSRPRRPLPAHPRRTHARRVPRPTSATNRSPGCSVRVSIETPVAANGRDSMPPVASVSPAMSRARSRAWLLSAGETAGSTATSSNGSTVVPTVWPCSWPLPATTSTSPAARPFSAASIAFARSPISRAPGQAASTAARIVAGSLGAGIVVGDDARRRRGGPPRRPSAAACRGRGRRRRRTPRAAGLPCAGAAPSAAAPAHPACARNRHTPAAPFGSRAASSIRPRTPVSSRSRSSASARPSASARAAATSTLSAWKRPGSGSIDLAPHAAGVERQHLPIRHGASRAISRSASPASPTVRRSSWRSRAMSRSASSVAASMSACATAGAPAGSSAGEQPQLGGAIGLQRAVIVQVVAGQVGERRRRQPHAVQPELVQPVRGRLHRRASARRGAPGRPASRPG